MQQDAYTPFCGTPPLPGELLTRWTLDPFLLVGLVAFAALLWTRAERRGQARRVEVRGDVLRVDVIREELLDCTLLSLLGWRQMCFGSSKNCD